LGVDLAAFVAVRPFLYHTTSAANLARIRSIRAIESAARLYERAGKRNDPELVRRRAVAVEIKLNRSAVIVRDQRPLSAASIKFEAGWNFARLVALLNRLTFFWPGKASGPIRHGLAHFERYAGEGEDLRVLRIATRELIDANRPRIPMFCAYNSGSPRSHPTAGKSPRGGRTFQSADRFDRTAARVIEVVFEDFAVLPKQTVVASSPDGPWRPLY